MDRATARAYVEAGVMPVREYVEDYAMLESERQAMSDPPYAAAPSSPADVREVLEFYADIKNWAETWIMNDVPTVLQTIEVTQGDAHFKASEGKRLPPAVVDMGQRARDALSSLPATPQGDTVTISREAAECAELALQAQQAEDYNEVPGAAVREIEDALAAGLPAQPSDRAAFLREHGADFQPTTESLKQPLTGADMPSVILAARHLLFQSSIGPASTTEEMTAAMLLPAQPEAVERKDDVERVAREIGLPFGDEVGEYRWREDMKALVRRNANGTDSILDPLPEIAKQLEIMLGSAVAHGDDEAITGYTIKTGALHHIIGLMMAGGIPVTVPRPSLAAQRPTQCFECGAALVGPFCPKCNAGHVIGERPTQEGAERVEALREALRRIPRYASTKTGMQCDADGGWFPATLVYDCIDRALAALSEPGDGEAKP